MNATRSLDFSNFSQYLYPSQRSPGFDYDQLSFEINLLTTLKTA